MGVDILGDVKEDLDGRSSVRTPRGVGEPQRRDVPKTFDIDSVNSVPCSDATVHLENFRKNEHCDLERGLRSNVTRVRRRSGRFVGANARYTSGGI